MARRKGQYMNFCDECGGIIVAEKEEGETVFKCRNCETRYTEEEGGLTITEEKEEEDAGMIAEENPESLPKTEATCGECGNDEAYWWMEQTRAADEPATRFFRCTDCSHTWREYD